MMKLVICHWDTDGIASAVLYTKATVEKYIYFTPEIGNYFLSPSDRNFIENLKADEVVLLDMSLPEQDLIFLNSISSNFEVFDHHKGRKVKGIKLVNPVVDGADPEDFPATTTVVQAFFRLRKDLFYYAGIFGDMGFKLKEDHPLITEIREYLLSEGVSFDKFRSSVAVIDAQYKTGDRERVYKLIDFLLEKGDILAVLEEQFFVDAIELVEKEKQREYERFQKRDRINFLFTPSRFKIVSDLCRMKFAEVPEEFTVVVGKQGDYLNFYLRTRRVDLGELILKIKGNGYFAGGKKDVIGVIIEPQRLEELVTEMEDYFKRRGECFSVKEILQENSLL